MTTGPGRPLTERAGALQRQLDEARDIAETAAAGLRAYAGDLPDAHDRRTAHRMATRVKHAHAILLDLPRVPGLRGGQ